jgi:hypothetical protein
MIPGPNWARRYGTQHRRHCARPGCGSPAAATLRFQPTQREAWLVDLDDDAARGEGDLCARHASALVLPRGWELHDERSAPVHAAAPVTPMRRTRTRPARPARRRTSDRDTLALPGLAPVAEPPATGTEDAPQPPPSASPVPAPIEEAEAPVSVEPPPRILPQLGQGAEPAPKDELTEVLDANTPLLQRAFRNTKPD